MTSAPANHRLLLWDIDGTLCLSEGASSASLLRAWQRVTGTAHAALPFSLGGQVDSDLSRRLLEHANHPPSAMAIAELRRHYLQELEVELPKRNARVLPGVWPALAAAQERGWGQGLLTGNWREGARLKLDRHGLWERFAFGAFADDAAHRPALGPVAVARAAEQLGRSYQPGDVWIIGDTLRDIACARANGYRVLAVATGADSWELLASHQPDALLPDLGDTAAFLRALGA